MEKIKQKLSLIVDSREQAPLHFREGIFDEIIVAGLSEGDYALEIDGKQAPLIFERKSFSDLFGTMTNNYSRFKAEMSCAKEKGITLILLIEGTMRDVAHGYEHSQFSGDSMLKKLAMLRVRHDLEWHCFEDRRSMARYIEEIFSAIGRNYKS